MGDNTGIAWTEATLNVVVGCSIVSPGCSNCYAQREAGRLAQWPSSREKYQGLTIETKAGYVWNGKLRFWPSALEQPLRWRRPRMIFVNSMSDLFHESMELDWLDKIWRMMVRAHKENGHIFQILTKRPENMLKMLGPRGIGWYTREGKVPCPEPGIWLGVSAEDERRWDERIPIILNSPTIHPWVSVEPQLEMIDRDPTGLGWAVIGGESGRPRSKARNYEINWGRRLRDRCKETATPFFFKQLGSVAFNRGKPYPTKHYAGADPDEWPMDIRVREYPK